MYSVIEMTAPKKPSTAKPASKRPTLKSSHGAPLSTSKPKASAGGATKKPAAKKPAAGAAKKPATPRTALSTAKTSAKAVAETQTGTRKKSRLDGDSMASNEARTTATQIAIAALDKKAVGLEILDVAGRVDYTDFLVLMTGRSDRQVAALAQAIEGELRKHGKNVMSVEGMPQANWVIMDYGDVVVHLFKEDVRASYDIESLWVDAQRLPVPHDVTP